VADNHVVRRRIPTGRLSTIPRYSSNVGVRTFSDLLATIDIVSTYVFTKLSDTSLILTCNQKSGGFLNMIPIVKYNLPMANEIQRQINITYLQALHDGQPLHHRSHTQAGRRAIYAYSE
jgi:hypothetical protein